MIELKLSKIHTDPEICKANGPCLESKGCDQASTCTNNIFMLICKKCREKYSFRDDYLYYEGSKNIQKELLNYRNYTLSVGEKVYASTSGLLSILEIDLSKIVIIKSITSRKEVDEQDHNYTYYIDICEVVDMYGKICRIKAGLLYPLDFLKKHFYAEATLKSSLANTLSNLKDNEPRNITLRRR